MTGNAIITDRDGSSTSAGSTSAPRAAIPDRTPIPDRDGQVSLGAMAAACGQALGTMASQFRHTCPKGSVPLVTAASMAAAARSAWPVTPGRIAVPHLVLGELILIEDLCRSVESAHHIEVQVHPPDHGMSST